MERKKVKFNYEEKRFLIECVKNAPIIWDKTHPGHCNRKYLKIAWGNVAADMNIDEQACRIAWKSLCDSRRYYRRKVGSKSDDNNLRDCDYSSDDSFAKPPPFEEEMKFLDYVEKTNLLSNKLSNPEMEEINQNGCMSPYSYINESINSTSQQTNCLNEPIFDMVEVEDYKETKYDPNQSDHNPMTAEKREKTSQQYERSTIHITKRRRIEETDNGAFLIHLDSILNKLPLNLSEGLQAKMMTMAYQELARHRSS